MKCYFVDGKGVNNLKKSSKDFKGNLNDHDVLINVKACSLNYRDLLIANGEYGGKEFEPFIPLSDMSGVIVEVGKKVKNFKIGDRVLNAPFKDWIAGTLTSQWARSSIGYSGIDGTLADFMIYPDHALVHLPDHLDFFQGSTFTVAGLTAWAALITHGKVLPGEFVLLHGTGGVSLFAAQLAKIAGAKVILTSSSEEKQQFVKKTLGVDYTVNYKDNEWVKQVKEITKGLGVNVVIDVAGGEILSQTLKVCAYGARVAVIGRLDNHLTQIDIIDLLVKQIALKGIYMESAEQLHLLMKAVESSKLIPIVDKVFSFDHAKEAYNYLASQKHLGKIVINVNS
ncbi:Beta-ketoacyl-acyl-carrier-protein synthase I [Candidatus Rubidus massiliensis]|nr:Beta-ketoacyl-acyl-carrier-protein synthase I [Candidatus Rubidus massiliensis]